VTAEVIPIRPPITRESLQGCTLEVLAFLDGPRGAAQQIRRCVQHPRLCKVWARPNRKDDGREFWTVDGAECANLDEAIDRLNRPAPEDQSLVGRHERALDERAARRRLSELKPPQQAALVGKEPRFWRFLADTGRALVLDEEQAKQAIYELCGIASRSELVPGTPEAAAWHELFVSYQIWGAGYEG
jgi:hypothetical protein